MVTLLPFPPVSRGLWELQNQEESLLALLKLVNFSPSLRNIWKVL